MSRQCPRDVEESGEYIPPELLHELYGEELDDQLGEDELVEELVECEEDEDEWIPVVGAGSEEEIVELFTVNPDGELIRVGTPSGSHDEEAGPSGVVADLTSTVKPENVDYLDMFAERQEMVVDEEWTPDSVIGVRLGNVKYDEDDEGIVEAQGRGRTSTRGRARGRGRGGRGAARVAARLRENVWRKGDRLIEIYPDDEDVPPEFRETMESLVRERVARQQVRRQLVGRREQARKEQKRSERSRSDHGRGVNVNDGVDVIDENYDVADDDDVVDDLPIHQDFIRFCQDEEATDFKWQPMGTFRGAKEAFLVDKSGPTQRHESGYKAFRRIWTDDFVEKIASETNRYASTVPQSEKTFHENWYPTNAHEILILFAFWMMLGIIQMPTIKSCFSLHPLLKTDVFRTLFSPRRYWGLNRALHFAEVSEGDSDRLKVLRPVIDHLNSKFQQLYVPAQHVCIDESLTLWKGNLRFRQYIKSKAAKYGIKTFELCESSTAYLWSFFVYTGRDVSEVASVQKSSLQVLKLMSPLLGKGHTLFLDNYFNSPLLARFLKRHKTDVVGTLRKGRSDVPRLISDVKLKEGHYVARHADDVVVGSFQDKKAVRLISTYHNMGQGRTTAKPGKQSQFKFNLVKDYNANMGGIDQKDAMLEARAIERKQCLKWYMKFFKRLINVSVQNSRVLVEKSKNVHYDSLSFRIELVEDIIKHHLKNAQPDRESRTSSSRSIDPARVICAPNRFHAIAKYTKSSDPEAKRMSASSASVNRRRCVYCRPNGASTVYECNICKVPLCLETCFIKYHTEPRY